MKYDAYQMVTDRICAMLEQGIRPWVQPWASAVSSAWSGSNGKPYSFLNQMLLADPKKKYNTLEELMDDVRGEWVTFNQAKDRGGCVRKGETGRKVVFFKMIERPTGKLDDDGKEKMETIPFLQSYTVFKISQCDGLTQKYHTNDAAMYDFTGDDAADAVANDYIAREGITFRAEKGDKAFYRPSEDLVVVPKPEQFKDAAEYYSTLYHELTHSTGHQKRLNRIKACAAFGKDEYSTEELVAEIGSASICATLGIENNGSFTNSVSYIGNWLKALRNDKRMIVTAASRAEKAVRMILNVEEN